MKHSTWGFLGSTLVLVLCLLGFAGRAEAHPISSLDFTSGAVNMDGRYGRVLDRLFGQDGSLTMGSFQSMSDIVDPVSRGHKSFSLFTSGMTGAAAPWATINGSSITVDLSSLFFGWTRQGEVRAWNIGTQVTGLFNPQTLEFSLAWDHLFGEGDGKLSGPATFFVQGKINYGDVAAVPVVTTTLLFGTGLGALLWVWRRKAATQPWGQPVLSA